MAGKGGKSGGRGPSSGQAFGTWDRMTAQMESGTMHRRTEKMYAPMQDSMRKSVEKRGGGMARAAAAAAEASPRKAAAPASAPAKPATSGKTRTDPYVDKTGRNFARGRAIVKKS